MMRIHGAEESCERPKLEQTARSPESFDAKDSRFLARSLATAAAKAAHFNRQSARLCSPKFGGARSRGPV